jgi:uncharacterized membrane protein (UPF0127 family)
MRTLLCGLLVLVAACSKGDSTGPMPTPSATVTFAGGNITAEVAASAAARETGLMGRTSLGAGAGMLFVFAADQQPLFSAFWMKNTSVPLSIAFIDASQRVINVKDMAPFDTVNLARATAPFRYALEVNQGWFATHGVTAGASASFNLPAGTVISP